MWSPCCAEVLVDILQPVFSVAGFLCVITALIDSDSVPTVVRDKRKFLTLSYNINTHTLQVNQYFAFLFLFVFISCYDGD